MLLLLLLLLLLLSFVFGATILEPYFSLKLVIKFAYVNRFHVVDMILFLKKCSYLKSDLIGERKNEKVDYITNLILLKAYKFSLIKS